jgi:hypothetical protein
MAGKLLSDFGSTKQIFLHITYVYLLFLLLVRTLRPTVLKVIAVCYCVNAAGSPTGAGG